MKIYAVRHKLLLLIGSIFFLALPFLLVRGSTGGWAIFQNHHLRRDLVIHPLMLGFFYLNLLVLMPKLYNPKHRWAYWGVMLGLLGLLVVLPTVLMHHSPFFQSSGHGHIMPPGMAMHPPPPPHPPEHPVSLHKPLRAFSFFSTFMLFLMAMSASMLIALQERLKSVEQQRLRAELAYLKAQVNPHFLFNSLNSIYALALSKSDLAAEAVLMLSGLMRYVLAESEKDTVSLEREVDYLSDYIALQKIRLGDTAQVIFDRDLDGSQARIVPLTLIPFFENAFKHGVDTEQESVIRIQLTQRGQTLDLTLTNNKVRKHLDPNEQSGIGLANVRDRLAAYYPGRHTLHTQEDDQRFTVKLRIQL